MRSFADAAQFFNPMLVTFTGGEPLMRRDLETLVAAVASAIRLKYVMLITHGGMLTADRARSLWEAGVNQFNVSLDYLDERHDRARGIPGLSARILSAVPEMRSAGIDNIRFNSVIKSDNLDQIMPIVRRAAQLGVGVNLSVYADTKNGNTQFCLGSRSPRAARRGSLPSCSRSSGRVAVSLPTPIITSSRFRALSGARCASHADRGSGRFISTPVAT